MLCRCRNAAAQRIFSGISAENVCGVMKMKEKIPREFPELPREPELQMGFLYDPPAWGKQQAKGALRPFGLQDNMLPQGEFLLRFGWWYILRIIIMKWSTFPAGFYRERSLGVPL